MIRPLPCVDMLTCHFTSPRIGAGMPARKLIVICGLVLTFGLTSAGQTKLTAREAKYHVGEQATVCGKVASTDYSSRSRGRPTFLYLDKPYSHKIFTILIWGSDRSKFGRPESTYQAKSVCVTGKIKTYRETPEIVATDPSQIKSE